MRYRRGASGTVVSLFLRSRPGANRLPGVRADTFRWVGHLVLGRDSAPPSHFTCVVSDRSGGQRAFIFVL